MRIDDLLIKSTTFLFVDKPNPITGEVERVSAATTFFAGVPLDEGNPKSGYVYAVTARHVLSHREYGTLWLRVNLNGGGYYDIEVPQDEWVQHVATDVAAIRAKLPKEHDHFFVGLNQFVTDEFIKQHNVGSGDDVFFTGLFTRFPGKQRTQPVVRFGNISLMPVDKVYVEIENGTYSYVDAYLAEAKSWGGQSGSPAWLYFPPHRFAGRVTLMTHGPDTVLYHLLGLVHGHYQIPTEVKFTGDSLSEGTVGQNPGIAIIIPAKYILEVLMSDVLKEEREEALKSSL